MAFTKSKRPLPRYRLEALARKHWRKVFKLCFGTDNETIHKDKRRTASWSHRLIKAMSNHQLRGTLQRLGYAK